MTITREIWYRHPEVMFNITYAIKDRETALLGKADQKVPPVRNIFANYQSFLKKNLDKFDFSKRKYNLYYSLARFNNIRLFSFSPPIRKEQGKKWNREFLDNIMSMDLGLDFDSKDHISWKEAYVDCKKVKDKLDEYGVAYSLKWSGSKGFHIRIPYNTLPEHLVLKDDKTTLNAVSMFNKSFAELLKMFFDLETLDLGVFDYRRVWKCDYSYVCETNLIALPLTNEEFETFSLETVKPVNVLKNGIRNRFDLMRKGEKANLKKFCEEELCMEW